MRHISSACLALLVTATSSSALAETLVIEPSSPNLTPSTFDYRYDSTRPWLLGCFGYDVLQNTGFYPQAWYHTANFTPADGDYRVTFQRTWLERFCAAKSGIYNYVQVAWTDPNDASRTYRGVIQVDAGGTDKLDEVTCELVDPESPYNALECERAVVSFSSSSDTYVIVHLSNLD